MPPSGARFVPVTAIIIQTWLSCLSSPENQITQGFLPQLALKRSHNLGTVWQIRNQPVCNPSTDIVSRSNHGFLCKACMIHAIKPQPYDLKHLQLQFQRQIGDVLLGIERDTPTAYSLDHHTVRECRQVTECVIDSIKVLPDTHRPGRQCEAIPAVQRQRACCKARASSFTQRWPTHSAPEVTGFIPITLSP